MVSANSVPKKSLKRKKQTPAALASRKKVKAQHRTASDLPWKTVSRAHELGLDIDEGILELEEVDNVEVVYEETEAGRVARFNVIGDDGTDGSSQAGEGLSDVAMQDDAPISASAETPGESSKKPAHASPIPQPHIEDSFDSSLLPEWAPFSLHPRLQRALYAQKFTFPTPIQAQALPTALAGRDIIGIAETGSGKTLAYGLPMLHSLLEKAAADSPQWQTRRPLRALVLAPTRELALQVSTHLNACLNAYEVADPALKLEDLEAVAAPSKDGKGKGKVGKQTKGKGREKEKGGPKAPPLVSVAAIVGGMSAQKQKRILDRGVDVLVATPGRLWDILEGDDELAKDMKALSFLVLDEADRMIETGHFAELDNILQLTQRQFQQDATDSDFHADQFTPDGGNQSEASDIGKDEVSPSDGMQTFVFSATLSKDLQRNLKKRHKPRIMRKGEKPASTLDDLLLRLDFRDPEPQVVDLSPEGGVVSTLQESKIDCLSGDKDIYLYYFLLRYPGRSLVFLSAIDGIRRLLSVLELLGLPVFPLHSQLEQRQRLKNLDRFKSHQNAILLATDIAARGLDIPSVDHVVHYQIPRSADAYVHRNGRTARAQRAGFSMLMCAPDERRVVRALLGSLGRQESDIPEMAVEHYLLEKLKPRLQLAKQIDSAQHRAKKANHERNWMRATAEAMDLELGSDFESSDGEDAGPSRREVKVKNAKTAAMKAELKQLLKQPLVARGVSTRYITSGSRPIVEDILSGEYHEGLVGVKKSEASADLVHAKKKPKKGDAEQGSAKYEEWTGFGSSS